MPLPLAAIATAATAAGMEYLRQRNQAAGAGGPQVGKLIVGGTALRASTAALLSSPAMGLNLAGPVPQVQVGAPATGAAGIGAAIGRALGGRGLNAPAAPMIQRGAQGLQQIQEFLITGGGARKKYRRMDHCNIKALRRAGRRLEGFVKLAKSMVQLHQRARIKKPRRRR